MPETDTAKTIAAVDLGSNSFHLVVAREAHGQLIVLDRLRVRVGLAEGLLPGGKLAAKVAERALECLRQFGQRLLEMPAAAVRAAGTNTFRQLKDGGGFLGKAEAALGHPIEIIDGREEARLIYLGVAHTSADDAGTRLVVDIGGGSTECILGRGFETLETDSLYMGCVNYSLRFFKGGRITARRFEQAELAARLELRPMRRRYREKGWEKCLGSSGTILAISSILRESGWTSGEITPAGLKLLRRSLIEAGDTSRLELPGLAPDRAPVLPGGLAILAAVFDSLKIETMSRSDGALREGVLYDLAGRIHHEDVRDRTIAAFCGRFQVDAAHAERVAKAAHVLLEEAYEPWRIDRDQGRRLLEWAARLHEIGISVSYHGYHRHGAYLVANSDMPGFSRDDRAMLAVLIGSHRRKIRPELLRDLPPERSRMLARLIVLFRLAVRLNRGRSSRPQPDIGVDAGADRLTLAFPAGWLDEHALTRAALWDEARRLRELRIRLQVK